jgi:hypothetical protein
LYALNDRWLRIAGITSLMILTIVSNGFLQQSLTGLALVRLLLFKFEHFISGNSNFSGNKLTGVPVNSLEFQFIRDFIFSHSIIISLLSPLMMRIPFSQKNIT